MVKRFFFVVLLLIIPLSVSAFAREQRTWDNIFSGLESAYKANTDIQIELLLGVLGQESYYGINIGKSVSEQKVDCQKTKLNEYTNTWILGGDVKTRELGGFIGWRQDDLSKYAKARCLGLAILKPEERIIVIDGKQMDIENRLKESEKLGYYGYLKQFCEKNFISADDCDQLETSYTFAVGFTQFQPDQWNTYQKKYPSLKNPWNFGDALIATGHKLADLNVSKNEIWALGGYYGSSEQEIKCHGLNFQGTYAQCVQERKRIWKDRLDKINELLSRENQIKSLKGEKN